MEYASLKKFFCGTVSAIKNTIYTVPNDGKHGASVVRELMVHNSDKNSDVGFILYINDIPFIDTKIAPKDSLLVGNEWYMVLEPGDSIAVATTKADVVGIFASGSETFK